MLKLLWIITKYKKVIAVLFLFLTWIFTLWQIDLMRHLFIYECSNMEDAWRVRFGFPPFSWFGIDFPLQTSFDLMYICQAIVVFILISLIYREYITEKI